MCTHTAFLQHMHACAHHLDMCMHVLLSCVQIHNAHTGNIVDTLVTPNKTLHFPSTYQVLPKSRKKGRASETATSKTTLQHCISIQPFPIPIPPPPPPPPNPPLSNWTAEIRTHCILLLFLLYHRRVQLLGIKFVIASAWLFQSQFLEIKYTGTCKIWTLYAWRVLNAFSKTTVQVFLPKVKERLSNNVCN